MNSLPAISSGSGSLWKPCIAMLEKHVKELH